MMLLIDVKYYSFEFDGMAVHKTKTSTGRRTVQQNLSNK